MAMTAEDAQIASQYTKPDSIERWKKLFGYSHMEAVRLISDQRGDGKPSLPAVHLSINSHNPQSHASASATTTGPSSRTKRKIRAQPAAPEGLQGPERYDSDGGRGPRDDVALSTGRSA
jgi:hypothetical protein